MPSTSMCPDGCEGAEADSRCDDAASYHSQAPSAVYEGHGDWVTSLCLHGPLLCSSAHDQTVRVLSRAGGDDAGRAVQTLAHPAGVLCVDVVALPSGHAVITGDVQGVVRAWRDGVCVGEAGLGKLSSLTVCEQDRSLYVACGRVVHMFSMAAALPATSDATGNPPCSTSASTPPSPASASKNQPSSEPSAEPSAAQSPQSQLNASAALPTITLGKSASSTERLEHTCEVKTGANASINVVIVSKDMLYIGSDDMSVRSCTSRPRGRGRDRRDTLRWRTFRGMTSSVLSLAANGVILAAGGYDGGVRLWNICTAASIISIRAHSQNVSAVVFDDAHGSFWTASADGDIKCWETNTGRCARLLETKSPILDMKIDAADAHDPHLFTASQDARIRSWSLECPAPCGSSDGETGTEPERGGHVGANAHPCSLACQRHMEKQVQELKEEFAWQLDRVRKEQRAKLDALSAEKDEVALENRKLLDMLRATMLENERLKAGAAAPARPVPAADALSLGSQSPLSDTPLGADYEGECMQHLVRLNELSPRALSESYTLSDSRRMSVA